MLRDDGKSGQEADRGAEEIRGVRKMGRDYRFRGIRHSRPDLRLAADYDDGGGPQPRRQRSHQGRKGVCRTHCTPLNHGRCSRLHGGNYEARVVSMGEETLKER